MECWKLHSLCLVPLTYIRQQAGRVLKYLHCLSINMHFCRLAHYITNATVKSMTAGTVNAQALACNTIQAIAASDARHAAVFARAGALPWLVALVSQWPAHACGRNAASALREILQDSSYQVHLHAC